MKMMIVKMDDDGGDGDDDDDVFFFWQPLFARNPSQEFLVTNKKDQKGYIMVYDGISLQDNWGT